MDALDGLRRAAAQAVRTAGSTAAKVAAGAERRATGLHDASGAGADDLLATFMKLNVRDPSNSPSIQKSLHDLVSKLRSEGVDRAEERAAVAQGALQRTESFGKVLGVVGTVAAVVVIVAAVSVAVLTLGAGAPLALAATALGVGLALKENPEAVAQATRAFEDLAAKAREGLGQAPLLSHPGLVPPPAGHEKVDAERTERITTRMQGLLRDGAGLADAILESRNKTVDAVRKMMEAMATTQSRLLAAGMGR